MSPSSAVAGSTAPATEPILERRDDPVRRRASRAPPPGSWRLLSAASASWAASAWAVGLPGRALWVVLLALPLGGVLLGAGAILVVRRRSSGSEGRGRAAVAAGAIGLALLICAAVLVPGARIVAAEYARDDPKLAVPAARSEAVRLRAVLAGFPESSESPFGRRFWVRAAVEAPRGGVPVLLWLPEEPDGDWAPGVRIRLEGTPTQLAPDGPAYGITVAEAVMEPVQPGMARVGAVAADLRRGLHETAAGVPGAELVPGFAVGDTSLVDEELERRMVESSLSHLTAVSGANCALVTGAVIAMLAVLRLGVRWRAVIAGLALLGFVLVVGPDASVQRAAVMAAVLLASGFGGMRAASLPSLGLAMLVLLCADPWQAVQPGFALSVAATAGILLLATPLARWLRRRLALPRLLALPIGVALAAQLACGPLLLLIQPGIPAIGVLANVVAGPAAPLGTGLGLLALLLAPAAPGAAHAVVWAASLSSRWVQGTAQLAAAVPGGRWAWPDGWSGALLLAGCEGALLLAWAVRAGVVSVPGGARVRPRAPWARAPRAPDAVRFASAVLVALPLGVGFSVVLVAPLGERLGVPRDWAVVACDVGQGDALLLRDPARPERTLLVDTGDAPARLLACLDRFGVGRISLAVLTHDDADHVGALDAVADRIDAALVSPTVVGERIGSRAVIRTLAEAGVPVRIGAAGTRGDGDGAVTAGPGWWVLAPPAGRAPSSSNGASLAMLVDAGPVRVLLLADTGREQQRALLAAGAELGADVIKVAHHGSRDQDPRLPAAVGARWGLVSVGADNGYGHPTPETLASLAAAGTDVLRTDLHGSIAIVPRPDGEAVPWVERVG